ncbi:MAG: hypothetical protein WC758_08065 [Candidatus Woesearchaeota archaeon]|jgi:hypothetical protein
MIISKIYNKLDIEQQENLVSCLVSGLVFGLVFGLVSCLVSGLVSGLVFGLVFGLVSCLVSGLVFGLVFGLVVILNNFSEALPFLTGFYPILFLIIGIFLLIELLFILSPKEKLKKDVNILWHTAKRKGECLLEVLLGLSAITQIYILGKEIKQYVPEILKWIGYIGAGIIILGIIVLVIYAWLKLNSLKYRK